MSNTKIRLQKSARWMKIVTLAGIVLLSLLTVYIQIRRLGGWAYLGPNGTQLQRHVAVLDHTAGDPWRFRVLSEYLVKAIGWFVPAGPRESEWTFSATRVLQNTAIGFLAWRVYERLSGSHQAALAGVVVLFFSISYSTFDSDLSFNTYSEVILYLLVLYLSLIGRLSTTTLVLITVVGVMNRETALFIPAVALIASPQGPRLVRAVMISFLSGALTYLMLRIAIGPGVLLNAYGYRQGWPMFSYNLRLVTLDSITGTVLIPFALALPGLLHPSAHRLRLLGLLFISTWLPLHFFAAVAAESRLFLVPVAIVVIPLMMEATSLASSRFDSGEVNKQHKMPTNNAP